MGADEIRPEVRQFIFDHIDSVEQLEVLIFLRTNGNQWYTSDAISTEFRSSPKSIDGRLKSLYMSKLISFELGSPSKYCYKAVIEIDQILEDISTLYRTRRHAMFELIFSPLKKGRQFADAFIISKTKKEGEDSDG